MDGDKSLKEYTTSVMIKSQKNMITLQNIESFPLFHDLCFSLVFKFL
jgi:hypothetical protein